MDMEEAMFGPEVKVTDTKPKKPKRNINLTKWFALGLGGVFGLSHIGMIGMISRKDNLPIISPPVGPYTSYKVYQKRDMLYHIKQMILRQCLLQRTLRIRQGS